MSYLNSFGDIKNICRICLTRCDNMVSLSSKLDRKLDDSPSILDALESILSVKIICKEKYPEQICVMCFGYIKISYDLKLIYKKSQDILEKHISLQDFKDLEDASISPTESYLAYLPDDSCIDELHSVRDDLEVTDNPHDDDSKKTLLDNLENTIAKNKNQVKWIEGNKFVIETDNQDPKPLVDFTSCDKNFVSKERRAGRLFECKETVSKPLTCEFCDYKFSSLSRKEYHIKMKHSFKVIKCDICNKIFKNSKALSYHNTTQHNSEGKQFVCKICGKGFYLKNGLDTHMDVHSRDVSKVICPICGKGFHYRGGLFYHMKMHRNERNYSCEYCSRKFLNISGLKKHIRIHTGERPYACLYCGRTFLSKNILDNHEKTHTGVKTKFCPYCAKGFITAYSLKVHISSHTGSTPCEYCKRSFLNSEVLKLHMKFKHNVK